MKKEKSSKPFNKTVIAVVALVLILSGVTIFFLYKPTSSKPEEPTRTVRVVDNYTPRWDEFPKETTVTDVLPADDAATSEATTESVVEKDPSNYMKVSVSNVKSNPTVSKSSTTKKEEKTEVETETVNTPATPTATAQKTTGSTGSNSSQTTTTTTPAKTTQPNVINYYYTDKNGNKTETAKSSGETVYIIDKGEEPTLSDDQIRSIIEEYLNSLDNVPTVVSGDGWTFVQEAMDTEAEDESGVDEMEITTTPETEKKDTTSEEADVLSENANVQVTGRLWTETTGRIRATPVFTSAGNITAIEWHEEAVDGNAYLINTDSAFDKQCQVDEGATLNVYAVVTFKDGTIRTSNLLSIKN